jgi:AAA ATPase domain
VGRGRAVLEREAELSDIEAAVAHACAGRGSLVVVEGQAGIGKSALVAVARDAAATAGARVLRARGGELERDFAFGVVRQRLEPALAEAPAAVRDDVFGGLAGEAARVLGLPGGVGGSGGPGAGADASFVVLHGLYWLCANLAAHSPLLMAVDDAHWADVPSLRLMASSCRGWRSCRSRCWSPPGPTPTAPRARCWLRWPPTRPPACCIRSRCRRRPSPA